MITDDPDMRFVLIEPSLINLDTIEYFSDHFIISFNSIQYPASKGLRQTIKVYYTMRNTKDLREADIREFFTTNRSFYIHIVDTLDDQGMVYSKCYAMNEKLRQENWNKACTRGVRKKEDTKKFIDSIYDML